MAGVKALGLEAELAPSWAFRSPFPQFFFPMIRWDPDYYSLSTALLILLQVVRDRAGIYESCFFLARTRSFLLQSMILDYH